MSNEEAIKIIKDDIKNLTHIMNSGIPESIQSEYKKTIKAYNMAIEALEQERFMNKPCVSHKVCYEDKVKVLDKIRAEIEEYRGRQLSIGIGIDDLEKGKLIALEYVISIIDKYIEKMFEPQEKVRNK